MTALEVFGEFSAKPRPLAADVRGLLRLHIADTVAAWVAASHTAEAAQLFAYRDGLRREESGASLDVAINCAVVRSSEVDDIHLASMMTPGSIVIPAALAIAAARPEADGQALDEAIVAGYEAMIRLGLALNGPALLARGIWPTYFGAAFGVAAAAARLLKLNATQTAHALGFALTQTAPGVGQQNTSTTTRWLAAGNAARNGWQTALAAQGGFTSDLNLFEGRYFPGIYDIAPDIAALTGGLGERVTLREVSFKPWCAARQSMAATQAFKEMIAGDVDAGRIEEIETHVPPPFLRMLDHGVTDADRLSRLTSMPYQIALAALDPDAAFDVGQAGTVPPAVRTFMEKVKVIADENQMRDFPVKWRARVRMRIGGAWREREMSDVPGDPAKPFDENAIRAKFKKMAGRTIGDARCDALMAEAVAVVDGKLTPAKLLASIEAARG